jgi:D-lactate dehydrogenase (cytochrome)
MAVPRRISQRPLQTLIYRPTAPWRASRLAGQRLYATEQKPKERESFKGQLYQSTHERVLREKDEQARFAQQREQQKAASSSGIAFIPIGRL